MSDIFISYASEDRSRAETLAKALEEQGWTVWWDKTIPPGKTFDQVIEEAIKAAKCVVVLWSKISIQSDWVKEEANIGKERKILVPAKIDPVDPPIGFGRIQAADLTDWEAETSHAGFTAFLSAISDIAGPPPQQEKSEEVNEIPESSLEQQLEEQLEEGATKLGEKPALPSPSMGGEDTPPKPEPRQRQPKAYLRGRTYGAFMAALLVLLAGGSYWLYQEEPETFSLTVTGEWSASSFSTDTENLVLVDAGGGKVSGYYNVKDDGKIVRGKLSGKKLKAYWVENSSKTKCGAKVDSRYYWGNLEIEFDEKFEKFEGLWGYCNNDPSKPFEGEKVK